MKYFTMQEFECRCWCGMPDAVKENIEALVANVLDPVRSLLGRAIIVNSGYRCKKHNAEIGASDRSQHIPGEAADVCAERRGYANMTEWRKANREIVRQIIKNGRFDQLIIENCGEFDLYPQWVHVSYKKQGLNRGQVLKKVAGRKGYVPLTTEELTSLIA